MKVFLVYSPAPREVLEYPLNLPTGTKVSQAVAACGVLQIFPELAAETLALGIWGKKIDPDQVLQELDRIEIYRELRVDPKIARRERFSKQGSKGAGLFASRRAGAKAGY